MASTVTITEVLEPPAFGIGRTSALFVDEQRPDRYIGLDCWYPTDPSNEAPPSFYELLPGIGFTAQARSEGSVVGAPPVILFSHGQSGNRLIYSQLCEALAARGTVVIALDHPGDTMADWIFGLQVDTATNQANRIADLAAVVDAVVEGRLFSDIVPTAAPIHLAGHSYGAFTAFSVAGGRHREAVASVIGLQPHLVPVDRGTLAAISAPTLIIAGAEDTSTPIAVDVHPAVDHMVAPVTLHVLADVGHQGCSDLGLFVEVAPQLTDLPDVVGDFLSGMQEGVAGLGEWRATLLTHVDLISRHLA